MRRSQAAHHRSVFSQQFVRRIRRSPPRGDRHGSSGKAPGSGGTKAPTGGAIGHIKSLYLPSRVSTTSEASVNGITSLILLVPSSSFRPMVGQHPLCVHRHGRHHRHTFSFIFSGARNVALSSSVSVLLDDMFRPIASPLTTQVLDGRSTTTAVPVCHFDSFGCSIR